MIAPRKLIHHSKISVMIRTRRSIYPLPHCLFNFKYKLLDPDPLLWSTAGEPPHSILIMIVIDNKQAEVPEVQPLLEEQADVSRFNGFAPTLTSSGRATTYICVYSTCPILHPDDDSIGRQSYQLHFYNSSARLSSGENYNWPNTIRSWFFAATTFTRRNTTHP